jgi:hypothetical protein
LGLPRTERGIEFSTDIAPHPNSAPNIVKWYLTHTPGVQSRQKNGKDFACISAEIRLCQP